MRSTRQMSITLPLEMAQTIKAKVASGAYASESEVVRDGLRALQERDRVIEHWLREDVAAAYDAHKLNPTSANSLTDVQARLEQLLVKGSGKDV
ncbi:MAG: type II toxin-antitoxin system ParD family antitoxin [Bosea sp. (in: a-proteobacteria)]